MALAWALSALVALGGSAGLRAAEPAPEKGAEVRALWDPQVPLSQRRARARALWTRLLGPEGMRRLDERERRAEERARSLSPEQKAAYETAHRAAAAELAGILSDRAAQGAEPMAREFTLPPEKGPAGYFVHAPAACASGRPCPAVLDFFLGGPFQFRLEMARMNRAADRFGFLAVYPETPAPAAPAEPARLQVRHPGPFKDAARAGAILDDLRRRCAVDEKRVYAAGGGPGGVLALEAARLFPGRFAAAGAVSLPPDAAVSAPPSPVPVAYFSAAPKGAVLELPAWLSNWLKADRCPRRPAQMLRRPGHRLARFTPEKGSAGAPAAWYTAVPPPLEGVALPGGFALTAWSAASPGTDARALMWEFFSAQAIKNSQ